MNFEIVMLSLEKAHLERCFDSIYVTSYTDQMIEMENKLIVVRGWEWWEEVAVPIDRIIRNPFRNGSF